MRNLFTLLIAVVVVAVLLAYMFAFQVRYDEVAVVETFGDVTAPATDEAGRIKRNELQEVVDPGSLRFDSGLYFRLPWPVQKVTTYSTRLRLLEGQPQEIQTADGNSVIVKSYLAWRIDNPHAFFTSVGEPVQAEDKLRAMMRNLGGVISSYDFADLVNTDPDEQKLAELERACTNQLRRQLEQMKASYGVRIEQYGIRRLELPEETTTSVFERMKNARQALAEEARSEGNARALTITSQAESHKEQILAFARRQAQALRTKGDREAAKYYDAFRQNEQFAIFLRQVEMLEKTLPHNTTFILDAKDLGPLKVLSDGPTKALRRAIETPATANVNEKGAEAAK